MPNVKSPEELNEDYYDKVGAGQLYDDYKPIKTSKRLYEEIKISNDKTVIKLIDKNQRDTLSMVYGNYINYNNKDYFEIKWTSSRIQKRGFLTYLFKILIYDMNLIIMSDSNHTSPGSKEFWKSHIRKTTFDIYRFNIKTNFKRKAYRYNDDQIWGLTAKELEQINHKRNKLSVYGDLNEQFFVDDYYKREVSFTNELSESTIELLNKFDYDIDDTNQSTKEYEDFVINYNKLIKSKELIRLIAQKNGG